MAKKNEKVQNPQEQKPSEQPTTPAKSVELSEEELQQVTGGFDPQPIPPGKLLPPDRS